MTKPLWEEAERAAKEAAVEKMFSFKDTKNDSVYGPYGYDGSSRINKSAHDPILMAHYLAGEKYVISQGGLNNSAVVASAKTHNGLSVADTKRDGVGMTLADAFRVVAFGMLCGVIGFIRGEPGHDTMVNHIHWVKVDAKSSMHYSAWLQLYSVTYGAFHGGAGLAGAPRARWYGPPWKGVTTWEKSEYNPKNGWLP